MFIIRKLVLNNYTFDAYISLFELYKHSILHYLYAYFLNYYNKN